MHVKLRSTSRSVLKFCPSPDFFLTAPLSSSRIHFPSIIQFLHVAFGILTHRRETEWFHFSPSSFLSNRPWHPMTSQSAEGRDWRRCYSHRSIISRNFNSRHTQNPYFFPSSLNCPLQFIFPSSSFIRVWKVNSAMIYVARRRRNTEADGFKISRYIWPNSSQKNRPNIWTVWWHIEQMIE